MTDRLYRLPAVIDRTGLGRSTIYEAMDRGEFPRPVRIGRRAVAWRESDLAKWLDAREVADDPQA